MNRTNIQSSSRERVETDPYSARIGTIGFVIRRHRPIGWAIRDVRNDRFDILAFALSGKAHYQCENEEFEAVRGTMLFFPRGTKHSARSDPNAPWSFISVGFELCPDSSAAAEAFANLPRYQRCNNAAYLHDHFDQLARTWNRDQVGSRMACRGHLQLLLHQYILATQHNAPSILHVDRIQPIIQWMHANIGRVESVATLAKRAGLSESRFRLLFTEMTGCSVTRYQNRLRIRTAQDLLASGEYSVSEVAQEMGFRDVYYFSRLFKRMTGVPPSAYRPH